MQNTDLILCRTDVTANRIRSEYDYSGQLLVCGASISSIFRGSQAGVPCPIRIKPYSDKFKLLYVTRYYPHKNLESIIEMFEAHRSDLDDVVVFLTIAPDQHPNVAHLLRRIDRLDLSNYIVNLGPIPHERIAEYYQHSDAMLMPTFLETLGVPYLEAIASKLPVLTSDLDFAHASCGNAALYFNPWDPVSIRDSIVKLRDSSELQAELVQNAKTITRDVHQTWDDVANDVLHTISNIVQARKTGDVPSFLKQA